MKKCVFCVIVLLFSSGVQGMDGIRFLESCGWFESVTISSTNLAVKLQVGSFYVSQGDAQVRRRASEYIENDDMLILTPDKETRFSVRHGRALWTPISFKNNLKGFRIITTSYWFPGPTVTNAIAYLALSDTPIEVGEDDVEMIMEDGEWVKYENKQPVITSGAEKGRAMVSPPSRKGKLGKGKEESGLEEEGQSKSNTLWLYVGVSLCALCAILYFIRRKQKT